jgi:uncharacterized protein YihD (DUF1040 family)
VEIPYRVLETLGTLGHKIYFFRPEIHEKSIQELERIAKENNFQDKFKEVEDCLLDYLVEFDAALEDGNIGIKENHGANLYLIENTNQATKTYPNFNLILNFISFSY